MTLAEWWAEFDAKMDEADKLQEITEKGGGGSGSAFSKREWADARRRHKEKTGT